MAGSLGAEHGINYRNTDFSRKVRDFTGSEASTSWWIVSAAMAGSEALPSLGKGGRLVTCGALAGVNPQTDLRRIFWNHLKIFGSTVGSRREFRQVLNFMELSGTRPIIDQVFPLREAYAAQQRLEEGKQFGKVTLRIDV
jgi:NADPH:quinone reductase-like Zn-dependent oxidoreductase